MERNFGFHYELKKDHQFYTDSKDFRLLMEFLDVQGIIIYEERIALEKGEPSKPRP